VIPFVLGAAIVYAALAGWTIEQGTVWSDPRPGAVWAFACGLPTLVTLVVGEAVRLARGSWTLNPRARRRLRSGVCGVAAGALGAAGISVLLATTNLPSPLVLVACPATAALLVTLPMRGWRRGWCVACGYDLRAATVKTGTGCPECGLVDS
jgi:ABC-type cobalamin transport system permease subunit